MLYILKYEYIPYINHDDLLYDNPLLQKSVKREALFLTTGNIDFNLIRGRGDASGSWSQVDSLVLMTLR